MTLPFLSFVKPDQVMSLIPVHSGDTVADFGSGSGHFALAFAQKVGKEGKVYALDIVPTTLESVQSQARILGINNIDARQVNLEDARGSGLEDESMDWVFMKDILAQVEKRDSLLQEAKRVLRKGGRMLVIGWDTGARALEVGPGVEHRLSKQEVVDFAIKMGFVFDTAYPIDDYHYALLFVLPN